MVKTMRGDEACSVCLAAYFSDPAYARRQTPNELDAWRYPNFELRSVPSRCAFICSSRARFPARLTGLPLSEAGRILAERGRKEMAELAGESGDETAFTGVPPEATEEDLANISRE